MVASKALKSLSFFDSEMIGVKCPVRTVCGKCVGRLGSSANMAPSRWSTESVLASGAVLQSRFGARPVSAAIHFCCVVRGLQTRGAARGSRGAGARAVLVARESIAWIRCIASSVETCAGWVDSSTVSSCRVL